MCIVCMHTASGIMYYSILVLKHLNIVPYLTILIIWYDIRFHPFHSPFTYTTALSFLIEKYYEYELYQ